MSDQSKALVPQDYSVPGSRPIRKQQHELYCRFRAQALGRVEAYRRANQRRLNGQGHSYDEMVAYRLGWRLEKKPEINERIQYLAKTNEQTIAQQRTLIAERLWSIHEADIGDAFEITPNGNEKPKRLVDMSPDFRKSIEKIAIDSKGNVIPQLYSKLAASKELRAMYAIGKPSEASEVSRLSDAELIQQLSDQAKELGVDIKLDYSFAQRPSASETEGNDAQPIDNTEVDKPKR